MKTVSLANHAVILPFIDYFQPKKCLKTAISIGKSHSENSQIVIVCQQSDIPFLHDFPKGFKDLSTASYFHTPTMQDLMIKYGIYKQHIIYRMSSGIAEFAV